VADETTSPPYITLDEAFRDLPRQLARQARKEGGLPASPDVGILADMIQRLRSAVELHLRSLGYERRIAGVLVAVPHMHALYQEDTEDALEYAGLIDLASQPYRIGGPYAEAGAAFNGLGFGLCSNYTDIKACDAEERGNVPPPPVHGRNQTRIQRILTVSFTPTMLAATWTAPTLVAPSLRNDWGWVADMKLGLNHVHDDPRESHYWAAVRDGILTPIVETYRSLQEPLDKVILQGPYAADERLRAAVDEVLDLFAPYLNKSTDVYISDDPIFVAANGAAEMAKRIWWTYNHTEPDSW
jgi:hypothetical protein